MTLSIKQRKHLKALAHHLNPIVQMGKNGYCESFVNEVKRGLKDHELIKVRVSCEDRSEFEQLADTLPEETDSNLVLMIGRIIVLYKQGDDPKIVLPKK